MSISLRCGAKKRVVRARWSVGSEETPARRIASPFFRRPLPTAYCLLTTLISALCLCVESSPASEQIEFERIVIDDDFPGGYQVEVADVNGNGKPDIIALGGGTVAWYENSTWTKRIITTPEQTPGVISSATADLDGDGKAEIAIAHDFAMREPKKGKLTLAIQGESVDDPWTLKPIADVPSIHRVRWGDVEASGRLSLVVAPIFGPDAEPPIFKDPAQLRVFRTGDDPKEGRWGSWELVERPVIHAIDVNKKLGGKRAFIFTADNQGVGVFWYTGMGHREPPGRTIVPGATGDAPERGASEIHIGQFADGRRLLTAIEPWHGNQVVVYPEAETSTLRFETRLVLDDTLDDGHALWVADLDGDGTDEIFAGHRGEDYRVSMYKYDGESWHRTVLDTDIAAQDLRGGDLDGDGVPDVVAIGGKTSNVVWYRPKLSR